MAERPVAFTERGARRIAAVVQEVEAAGIRLPRRNGNSVPADVVFPAKILAASGAGWTWEEVVPDGAGGWATKTEGRTSTTTGTPTVPALGYEFNGGTPTVNNVYPMWRRRDPDPDGSQSDWAYYFMVGGGGGTTGTRVKIISNRATAGEYNARMFNYGTASYPGTDDCVVLNHYDQNGNNSWLLPADFITIGHRTTTHSATGLPLIEVESIGKGTTKGDVLRHTAAGVATWGPPFYV